MQTTSASAPAGVDVICSMSLCSIKVILIYIPVRSAGGGLAYNFHVKRSAFSATGLSVVISVIFRALRGSAIS